VRGLLLLLVAGCGAESHPCASSVTKGPWVERVDDARATILWESSTRGCVEAGVRVEGAAVERTAKGAAIETHVVGQYGEGFLMQPDEPGTYWRNEVALTALQPATCYTYRVRGKSDLSGRFCTMRAPRASFSFLAIGDTNPILGHTVPTLMHAVADPIDFSLHLGDMQYYSSVAETWSYWFGVMRPLLAAGAIFPTIGNHEFETMTELDDYYLRLFAPASVEPTVHYYHFATGGVHFFATDSETLSLDDGSEQLTWLTGALAAAKASPGFRFSIVYFHRPIYTVGDKDPQLDNAARLEPIWKDAGVKLVLQAHMHGYERFEMPSGITFVTCAGGGGVIGDVNANVTAYPTLAARRVAASDHYHACRYSVGDTLSSTVIDEFGAVIDSFEKAVP
jgi:hypothetical protein